MELLNFIAEFMENNAGKAYTTFTCLFVIFLYWYVFHMYRAQKNGTQDYEKYADLALHDNLDDKLIEPHTKN